MKVLAKVCVWVAVWASLASAAPTGTSQGHGSIQHNSGEARLVSEAAVNEALQVLGRPDTSVQPASFVSSNTNTHQSSSTNFHSSNNPSNFLSSAPASVTIIHSDSGNNNNFGSSSNSQTNNFQSAGQSQTFISPPSSTNTQNSSPGSESTFNSNTFNSATGSFSFQSAPSPVSSFQSAPSPVSSFESVPASTSSISSAPASVQIFQGAPIPQFTQTSQNTLQSSPVSGNTFQSLTGSVNSFQSNKVSSNSFQSPASVTSFQSAPVSDNNSFQSSLGSITSFQSDTASVNTQSGLTSDKFPAGTPLAINIQLVPNTANTFQAGKSFSDATSSTRGSTNSLSVNRQGQLLGSGEVLHNTDGSVLFTNSGEVFGGGDFSQEHFTFGLKDTANTGLQNFVNSGVSLASQGVPFTGSGVTGVPLPLAGDISTSTTEVSFATNLGNSGAPQSSGGISILPLGNSGEINTNFGSGETAVFLSSGENIAPSDFFGSLEVQHQNTGSSEVHFGQSGLSQPVNLNFGGSFEASGEKTIPSDAFFGSSEAQLQGSFEVNSGSGGVPLPITNSGGSFGGSIGSLSSSFPDGNIEGSQIIGSSEVSPGGTGLSGTFGGNPATSVEVTGASIEDFGSITLHGDGRSTFTASSERNTGQISSNTNQLISNTPQISSNTPQISSDTTSSGELSGVIGMLLNNNAHQIDNPGQTLGSFLMELNGQNGIVVLPASSLDEVQSGNINAAASAASLPNTNSESVSGRSGVTENINDFRFQTASSGTSVTVTQGNFVSTTPSTATTTRASTTTRRTTTTTTTEPPLFRGPLSDLLFAKGQFFGQFLGGMMDLGRTMWDTLVKTGVI